MNYNVSVHFAEQPEGGYTVTCEELPELVTEGDSEEEAMENLKDAYTATLELYEDLGRSTPDGVQLTAEEMTSESSCPWFSTMPPEPRVRSDADVPADNGQLRFEAMLCGFEMKLSARKMITLGCQEQPRRGRGSHRIWRNALTGGSAVAPDYGGRDLRIGTIRAALRNLGVGWGSF